LTTPTTPAQASVSNANVGTTKAPSTEELIREDVEEGVLADKGEDGTGMPENAAPLGQPDMSCSMTDSPEMFGFKLSPQATATGGQSKISGRPIYLDMQATTPMDPRVLDKMLPLFTEQYGNPHSRTHAYGWEAESAVDEARQHVASLIGAGEKDIVFTSGATESNNMLIKGIARFHQGKRRHIITTQTVSPHHDNV
jgi:cysteine desulfurase